MTFQYGLGPESFQVREREASKNIPSVNSSSTPKESLFSVKGQLVNILGFQAIWSLPKLCTLLWQLKSSHRQHVSGRVGLCVCEQICFQTGGASPQVVVCQLVLYLINLHSNLYCFSSPVHFVFNLVLFFQCLMYLVL